MVFDVDAQNTSITWQRATAQPIVVWVICLAYREFPYFNTCTSEFFDDHHTGSVSDSVGRNRGLLQTVGMLCHHTNGVKSVKQQKSTKKSTELARLAA
jgi:hypothetical protein